LVHIQESVVIGLASNAFVIQTLKTGDSVRSEPPVLLVGKNYPNPIEHT